MSQIFVSNVAFSVAGSTRIDVDSAAANLKVSVDSANVMYSNPIRTVFPTGSVNVSNSLEVSGRANVVGDIQTTGNVYSKLGRPITDSAIVNVLGGVNGNNLDFLGYANSANGIAREIRIKLSGFNAGATGSLLKLHLSEDHGVTWSAPKTLGYATPNSNAGWHDIVITNCHLAGVNKNVIAMGGGGVASVGYAQANVVTDVIGIITGVKLNSTGSFSMTTGASGVGGCVVYGIT